MRCVLGKSRCRWRTGWAFLRKRKISFCPESRGVFLLDVTSYGAYVKISTDEIARCCDHATNPNYVCVRPQGVVAALMDFLIPRKFLEFFQTVIFNRKWCSRHLPWLKVLVSPNSCESTTLVHIMTTGGVCHVRHAWFHIGHGHRDNSSKI